MKSMRSYKKRGKHRKRRPSLEERVTKALERLPKWRKKYIYETPEQKAYTIRNMVYSVIDAQERDVKVNIFKAFLEQSNQGLKRGRAQREGTLRDVFRAFRTQDTKSYNYYNTYMYRKGYSASQYFYNPDNSTISDQGYSTVVELDLPSGSGYKYGKLVIEFDWQNKEIISANFV